MTPDERFAAAVRQALAARVAELLDEDDDGDGDGAVEAETGRPAAVEHRELAAQLLTLVAAARGGLRPGDLADLGTAPERLLELARFRLAALRGLQGPSGLFTGGDNVDSPPDSAFSVNDLAQAAALLRRGQPGPHGEPGAQGRLAQALDDVLAAVTPGLVTGGVHTPNHRWELCAALAWLHRLHPRPELAARIDQWLSEGIDQDDDGSYSERSAHYAAQVSNPSLLTVARVMGRPDLVAVVERNLEATLDLLLPDGSVETVHSRRQDQRWPVPLSAFLLPLREVALVRGRGDLAWAAELALQQGPLAPTVAALLLLEPAVGAALPAAVAPRPCRRRVLAGSGLVVQHTPRASVVVFGGSDHARHGRVRSGLASNPTFLRLLTPAVALDSVRLSRTFFGLGPFRADGLAVEDDAVVLRELVGAGYHQPLAAERRDAHGAYPVVDEGRFSAAMDFGARERDVVELATTVTVHLADDGAELAIAMDGPAVDWALELALRPGGVMAGARRLGEHRWQLELPGRATYRVGDAALSVAVEEASAAGGGPVALACATPVYEPGEEYRFLGGTDAAGGELVYLSGRTPCRLRLRLRVTPGGTPHSIPNDAGSAG